MTYRDRILDNDHGFFCGEPFCDGDHVSSGQTCEDTDD